MEKPRQLWRAPGRSSDARRTLSQASDLELRSASGTRKHGKKKDKRVPLPLGD